MAVILDSPVGLHQGGQVSAPVFNRVAQQVLEYLHVAHDVDLPANRQVLLARSQVKEDDLTESSPDRLGAPLELADNNTTDSTPAPVSTKPPPSAAGNGVVQAALRAREPIPDAQRATSEIARESPSAAHTSSGTVVLEVEQGGVEVPSFLGKSVRASIEAAQESGLELDAVGSGVARAQSPEPGSHVPAGARVTVRFAR